MAAPPPTETDFIRPFRIEGQNVNGRIVRLQAVVTDILTRHNYPDVINHLLGEALVLAAMLGSSLKFDGRFILQLQGGGAISMLMAEYKSAGEMRAYARFDAEALAAAQKSGVQGLALMQSDKQAAHMAFTIEQRTDGENYQGIVSLEGDNLAQAALGYFERSEQISTRLKLASAPIILRAGKTKWCAGGIMLQQAPDIGGKMPSLRQDDDWHRLAILLDTTQDSELLDNTISVEKLLYRLFNEDDVRLFEPRVLRFLCSCSRLRVQNMLRALPDTEQTQMQGEDKIEVRCEFCAKLYQFSPQEAFTAD